MAGRRFRPNQEQCRTTQAWVAIPNIMSKGSSYMQIDFRAGMSSILDGTGETSSRSPTSSRFCILMSYWPSCDASRRAFMDHSHVTVAVDCAGRWNRSFALVAPMFSENHDWLSAFFDLVRIFVPMVLEVSLLESSIRRLWWTMCEQLQRICSFAVVVPLVTSVSFRLHSPVDHVVPIAALSNLAVANVMRCGHRHGCVVGHTHDVLSQPVQTVIDVVEAESLVVIVVLGDDSFANEFLQPRSALDSQMPEARRTKQCRSWIPFK